MLLVPAVARSSTGLSLPASLCHHPGFVEFCLHLRLLQTLALPSIYEKVPECSLFVGGGEETPTRKLFAEDNNTGICQQGMVKEWCRNGLSIECSGK